MLYTALHLKDIRKCDRTSGLLTLEQIAATQMLHYVDWIQTMMQTTFKFFPCPCCLLPIWIQTIPNPSTFARPPPRNTVCWMSFQSQWKITPPKKKGATKNDFSLATVNPWYESLLDMLSSTDVSCLTWMNFSFCATLYWSLLRPISFIFWHSESPHIARGFSPKTLATEGCGFAGSSSSIPWPVKKKRWRVVPVIHMGVSKKEVPQSGWCIVENPI